MARGRSIAFYVPGAPVPQGSMTAHATKRKDGSLFAAVHYPSGSKLHKWRRAIAVAARAEWGEGEVSFHPVTLTLDFYMPRPLSHYIGVEKALRHGYDRVQHDSVPDLDKLVRAAMDALTGVIYEDDRQVTALDAWKLYTTTEHPTPGLLVSVHALSQ